MRHDTNAHDLAAMDAMGWDLAAAVPEPASPALLSAGLGLVGWSARRRQAHRAGPPPGSDFKP